MTVALRYIYQRTCNSISPVQTAHPLSSSALLLLFSDDMFSKATLFATVLAACIGASAAPQEIWNPKITSPDAGTVWPAGSTQLVTWWVTAQERLHEQHIENVFLR